ncbi:MAG: hypothetical protein WCD18_11600, partial [Thermosynechococcaceae cyanobacterium]
MRRIQRKIKAAEGAKPLQSECGGSQRGHPAMLRGIKKFYAGIEDNPSSIPVRCVTSRQLHR